MYAGPQRMHPEHEQLAAYLEGTMADFEADTIDRHLEICPECEALLEQMLPVLPDVIEKLQQESAVNGFENELHCREMISVIKASRSSERRAGESGHHSNAWLIPGTMIRDYAVVEQIGLGGMGAVYRARHTRLLRDVAIKVLPAYGIGTAAVERFRREMETGGQTDHPHLVRVTDAGEVNGLHFLVMELVDGADLGQISSRIGPMSVADACECVRQAAVGLQHLHERGFVHRDIKPSNLMLTPSHAEARDSRAERHATIKILDFGLVLSKRIGETANDVMTQADALMGTADYMAPEQGYDAHEVDIRADLYSLGATLYKLLTGRTPFSGPAYNSRMRKFVAIATEEPETLQDLRPDVPKELSRIVHQLLSKLPEQRPESPRLTAQLLLPFCKGANLAGLLESPVCRPDQRLEAAGVPMADQGSTRDSKRCLSGVRKWARPPIWLTGILSGLLIVFSWAFLTLSAAPGTLIVKLESQTELSSVRVDGRIVQWTFSEENGLCLIQVQPGQISSIQFIADDGTSFSAEVPEEGILISSGKPVELLAKVQRDLEAVSTAGVSATSDTSVIAWIKTLGGEGLAGSPSTGYVVFKANNELPGRRIGLVSANLSSRVVSNSDLSRFSGLKSLTTLALNETSISDEGLETLGDLPELAAIFLTHTEVSDRGLKCLTRYPKLQAIHLSDTRISDDGLQWITSWPHLVDLTLINCRLTDRCIEHLSKARKLKSLLLAGTTLTRAGVEQLCVALPDCRIDTDFGTFGDSLPAEHGEHNTTESP